MPPIVFSKKNSCCAQSLASLLHSQAQWRGCFQPGCMGRSSDTQFRGAKQQKGTILGPHSIRAQPLFFPILEV